VPATEGKVRITSGAIGELLAHARRDPCVEVCGLLAGHDGVINTVLPAHNFLASRTAFEIAPAELFTLFRRIREFGLEHAGIYHSHPTGENAPSARDIGHAFYPALAYFIVSPGGQGARAVRAFAIRGNSAAELPIEVVGLE